MTGGDDANHQRFTTDHHAVARVEIHSDSQVSYQFAAMPTTQVVRGAQGGGRSGLRRGKVTDNLVTIRRSRRPDIVQALGAALTALFQLAINPASQDCGAVGDRPGDVERLWKEVSRPRAGISRRTKMQHLHRMRSASG